MHIKVASTPRPSDPSNRVDVVLVINSQAPRRFRVGFVPAGSEARQVSQGPKVPGPWAFVWEKASAIDGRVMRSTTPEHNVVDGDVIEIDGALFVVHIRNRFVELVLEIGNTTQHVREV